MNFHTDGFGQVRYREMAEDAKEAGVVAILSMLLVCAIVIVMALFMLTGGAEARGFDWFFGNVKPSGKCPGREIAASYYWTGRHTASGEAFDANGNTAASRGPRYGGYAIGSIVTLTNPLNGRSVIVRINDSGPYGVAHRLGVKLDLARGAAQRLGMRQTGWLCAS